MSWRVLKFGGTSVGSPAAVLAARAIVLEARRESRVLVVVSALSGVTAEIERELDAALARDGSWRDRFRALRDRHRELLGAVARRGCGPAASCGVAGRAGIAAADALDLWLERLRHLLRAAELLGEASPRLRDRILATGERLAAPIFAAALAASGIAAVALDGTEVLVADGPYGDAVPDVARSRLRLASRLATLGEALPVACGFFGGDAEGAVRLFGRGGSDTSATALGAALDAARVEIWTDVDGVAREDPRSSPDAEFLPWLTYDELEELARAGARVVHWKAIAPARAGAIPILVRNTFRPGAAGTWIGQANPGSSAGAGR